MALINHLRGKVTSLNPAYIVIEAGGVGYGLFISLQTYSKLGNSQETILFVESVYIRDDNPKYYGFFDEEERDLFRKLIAVSAITGKSSNLSSNAFSISTGCSKPSKPVISYKIIIVSSVIVYI